MTATRPIRVLIVDDQAIVREGLCALLAEVEGIDVVGQANDGSEAVRKTQQLQPDIVLMDLMMPGMNGIEATKLITRDDGPEGAGDGQRPRVLVLTSFAGDDMVFPALKAGALGYLLKDSGSTELVQAIRQVHRHESWLHPTVARKVLREMQQLSTQRATIEPLTPRENEVLRLLARGLDDTEIADELVISEVTVRSHISNILGKLHVANRVQATLFALNQGWVSLDDGIGGDNPTG